MRKLILLFFLYGFPLYAQELLPFVENFTKSEYAGDNQVWNVVQGNDNALYFANNHYLLRYNGVVWEKYSLPNKTIIRSIFADGDRIYSGSYKEFGYWKRIEGRMRYFSLSNGLRLFEGISDNEEIWKVFRCRNEIFFQSFNELFIYRDGDIRKIRFPSQISYCYAIDGQIFAASVREGLLVMRGDRFVPAFTGDELKDNVIHHIERSGGFLYIFTKNNGVFVQGQTGLVPWANALNAVLKDQVIITAKFIGTDKMAIGTALGGVYLVNLTNGSWQNLNRRNAIKNNTVLSIGTDKEGDLWLGLDNGICHLEINSPVMTFTDNSGILGSVYSLVPFNEGYLLATNHGLFIARSGKLDVVPDSQGQIWDIYRRNGQYIVGHNDGTFLFDGTDFKRLNRVSGGWQLMESRFEDAYFQANYSGIAAYSDPDDFSSYRTFSGLTKPIRKICQDKKGELWAADNYRSLYRICFDAQLNATKIENVSRLNGIDNDYGVKMLQYKGKTLFFIDGTWYRYETNNARLKIEQTFSSQFKNISDIAPVNEKSFVIVRDGLLYLIVSKRGEFTWRLIPEKYYQGKLILENIKIFEDRSRLLVNLDDGFMSFDSNAAKRETPKVNIEVFYNKKLISKTLKIKYNESVTIHASSEYYGFSRPDLFYRLNGENGFQQMRRGMLTLNNLESGDQFLEIFINDGQEMRKVGGYEFRVGYPWYASFWMVMLYILVLTAIGFVYYRWNNLRYRQKLALREEEMRHQRDIMAIENELRIQEYEKHILELEIQSKATEVAGKSFSIAKQGEVMDSIRKILDNESDANKIKSDIKRAIKSNSIDKHEWEAFETNMKQIHSEFVTRLLAEYPHLSSKDVRLSIYLRMNLSSKEIAPLMNISFRGVELHRYRLRKKINLSPDVNLNKHMMEI